MTSMFHSLKGKLIEYRQRMFRSVGATARPMRICMLGPRGVGKTSVVTAMHTGLRQAVNGTDLFLIAEPDTQAILNAKKTCLTSMFSGLHGENEMVTESGISGDAATTMFSFTYGMNSQNVNIGMEIRDYPGEYLLTQPETVAEYVREADAILVVIDTPCLMEEGGRYNEGRNRPQLVMDFLMKNLDNTADKLVLFVPLKCECYCADGRIALVTEKIRKVYAPLIDHLRDKGDEYGFHRRVCCAVTPIQTLGGVAFHDFERGADGSVKEVTTSDGSILPARVNYRFTSGDAAYAPRNCAQPLYYLLGFFSKQYELLRKEKNSRFLTRLIDIFCQLPDVDLFMLEAARLSAQRREHGEGYQVLFGRGRI